MYRFYVLIGCFISSIISCYSQSAFFNLAKQYAEKGDYKEAIRLTKQSLDLDTTNPYKLDLFLDYEAICDYFSHLEEPDSCSHYADLALNIFDDIDGLEPLTALELLSNHLLKAGCFERALDYRKKIFYITQNTYGSDSPQLVNEYCMLSWFYQNAGDNLHAVEYAKKEEELAYKTRNVMIDFPYRRTYEESFSSLRSVIQKCDEPIAGIQYLLKILNEHRDAIDSESRRHTLNSIWAISRDNNFLEGCLAVYKEYTLYGTYKEKLTNLININVEDLNIKNDVHAPEYAQSLYNLVINDELAQWFSDEEIESLLWLLPDYYGKIGLVRESFEMAKKNLFWRKENNKDLFFCDVRVLISGLALPEEAAYAADFGESLLESHRYDGDNEILQMIYENIAGAYLRLGDNERANYYIEKIGHSNEYQSLYAKAGVFMQSGDMKSLLPLSLKLNEFKEIPEENRALILLMLMMSARDSRKDSILHTYAKDYVSTYREQLLHNIPLMSEEEQTKYIRNIPFSNILSYDFFIGIDEKNHIEWSVTEEAYNYSLLKKGILLTSQNEFRKAIKNSSDSLVQSQWKRYRNREKEYTLQNEIITRNLINHVSRESSYTTRLSYTWKDIRSELREDEAAIEFIMCYNFKDFTDKKSNPIFLALIIRKECEGPIAVVLSPVFYFAEIHPNELLSSNNLLLYNKVWQPMEPYLEGVKKIYFSPVENLNSAPIEYASMGAGRVCDKWEIIRVSSTREIIDYNKADRRERAVLYGGLQYDLNKDDLIAASRHEVSYSSHSSRAIIDENLRYKVNFLPGSFSEVTNIASLFASKPQVVTGPFGTESSFKSLVGSSFDIIHLATHGFFWNENDVNKHENIDFLHNEHYQSLSKEDNAMLRSGLVFSGASVYLAGEELPDDVEDGILTAQELSTLNLGNADLVVLSACDSGLGEISAEGVFGLQRGFKLAGAKSILMSLWKVDDFATSMLMTEFYKQYLSGKSKRESLYLAQLVLRKSEEFSDPYYWASFILLD